MNLARFQAILRRAVLLPVLGLVLLSAIFGLQILRLERAMERVDRHDQVLVETSRLLRHAVDAETGLRGYEATGDEIFLEPEKLAIPAADKEFSRLSQAIGDAPDSESLAQLKQAWQKWLAFDAQVQQMQSAGQSTRDVPLNLEGKKRMDTVRADVKAIVDYETAERTRDSSDARRSVTRILLATMALTVLVGILIGLYVRREMVLISRAYDRSIVELQEKSAEVEESEQWLRTTLRSIGDAVITCDAQGNVEFMNPVAERLTAWSHAEARGVPLTKVFNIVNERSRMPVENPVDKVRRLNTVVGLANHTVLIAKDGSEYNIDDSGAPIREANGEMAGIVLIFRDITEQRRTEQTIIATEKLAVAGRLAASIAHEIHNPLDSVSNLLYLMQQENGADAEYLNIAREELARVTQISRAMLSVYRESPTPVPADIKDLMENVLVLLDRKLRDNVLQLDVQMETVTIQCFPSELRQVFINLLSNAAEASTKGGTLRIRVMQVPPNSLTSLPMGGARIEISDDGFGIPVAVREKLFTPFFTTKGEHGTGLGLWISRSMVEKHGGAILVNSSTEAQNHGTTFTVLLPASVAARAAA